MIEHVDKVKAILNGVSPSLCLAKWTQVTIHLESGQTHSCHHPPTHTIPLAGLAENPSQLHNTPFKKKERWQMLNGERPSGCDFCWKIEDSGSSYSDRHLKSADQVWGSPRMYDVISNPWDHDIFPSYVEVSFSAKCQMACSYCGPHVSTRWRSEVAVHGPYPTSQRFGDVVVNEMEEEVNPYVKAFMAWWPDLFAKLKVFRITGGEPLLSPNTWTLLEYAATHVNKDLEFSINSNLSLPTEKLRDAIRACAPNLRQVTIFTSLDTSDAQAEYTRHGLDYAKWKANMDMLVELAKEIHNLHITIMCTFNVFSLPGFSEFIRQTSEYRTSLGSRFWIDVSYLRYPSHQTVQIVPKEWAVMVDQFAAEALTAGWTDIEAMKISRIADWMRSDTDPTQITSAKKDFYAFVTEHDRRRHTDFKATFPTLVEFYNHCGTL